MLLFLSVIESEDDRDKFERLYLSCNDLLLKIAYGITGNYTDAEDVVYSSYCKLAENFDRYSSKPLDELTALCITIVKHRAIDLLRKEKRIANWDISTMELYDNHDADDPECYLLKGEEQVKYQELLRKLPDSLYEVLDLKYYQQLSNREIADLLGLKLKTVEMRLYRGKEKIRELLQND